eukprot:s520_g19.t1
MVKSVKNYAVSGNTLFQHGHHGIQSLRIRLFCSLWEAQSRAFLLQHCIAQDLFDLDFDEKTNFWAPALHVHSHGICESKPDPAHAPALYLILHRLLVQAAPAIDSNVTLLQTMMNGCVVYGMCWTRRAWSNLNKRVEIAHSLELQAPFQELLAHADGICICTDREAQGLGLCSINVGRRQLPHGEPVRIHDGLGLVIEISPRLPRAQWDDVIFEHLHRPTQEYAWDDLEEDDTSVMMDLASLSRGSAPLHSSVSISTSSSSSSTSTESSMRSAQPLAPAERSELLRDECHLELYEDLARFVFEWPGVDSLQEPFKQLQDRIRTFVIGWTQAQLTLHHAIETLTAQDADLAGISLLDWRGLLEKLPDYRSWQLPRSLFGAGRL